MSCQSSMERNARIASVRAIPVSDFTPITPHNLIRTMFCALSEEQYIQASEVDPIPKNESDITVSENPTEKRSGDYLSVKVTILVDGSDEPIRAACEKYKSEPHHLFLTSYFGEIFFVRADDCGYRFSSDVNEGVTTLNFLIESVNGMQPVDTSLF